MPSGVSVDNCLTSFLRSTSGVLRDYGAIKASKYAELDRMRVSLVMRRSWVRFPQVAPPNPAKMSPILAQRQPAPAPGGVLTHSSFDVRWRCGALASAKPK